LVGWLRRLGFRFVGSSICSALLQSGALVDDYLVSCLPHSSAP
jgi:3-methyladenine DNA glycosylase Tag